MIKPIRIQRRRSKGWKMPPNTVYVGRPTRFGNYLFDNQDLKDALKTGTIYLMDYGEVTLKEAFKIYREEFCNSTNFDEWLAPLVDKNLACWCPLDQPCHADVLLELAND